MLELSLWWWLAPLVVGFVFFSSDYFLRRKVAAKPGTEPQPEFASHLREGTQAYAGFRGAVLPYLSYLSLHALLSERWLRDRDFDVRGCRRILDVGCGAGQCTQHLAKWADAGTEIVGCDLSREMLIRARQRLRDHNIQWVTGDLTCLPFDDGSFDGVTCNFVLEHLADPQLGLAELARVLVPNGRMLLVTTEDRWTGRWTARAWHCRAYCRRELQQLCQAAGFRWQRELWFSPVHRLFGLGGIGVTLQRCASPQPATIEDGTPHPASLNNRKSQEMVACS